MNQPAFPTGIITDDKGVIVSGSNGMSLRDYFAAKAMQAAISRNGFYDDEQQFANYCYETADAMLKARKT